MIEKIRNGDPVIYRDKKGYVYGKPRETKFKGLVYTIRIGNDYVKATSGELLPDNGSAGK